MRYVSPSKRPGRTQTSADQIRRMVHMEEARHREAERPFDPEAQRESYAKPHHFAVNADGSIQYVLKQIEPDGLWVSEVFSAATNRHVSQAVIAGSLFGHPRWAETPDGRFLYGVDAHGKELRAAPAHAPNAGRRREGEMMVLGDGREAFVPDVRFATLERGERLHPTRGSGATLVVEGADGTILGWASIDITGEPDVKTWMARTGYHLRGQERWEDAARRHAPNASRGSVDEHAATELVLYIENDSFLSPDGPSGQGRSILLNALRKWKKGTYDFDLSIKLFEHLTDTAAKRYTEEFGGSRGHGHSQMFNVPTRREAARQLAESFRASAQAGEYDHVNTALGQ